MRQFVIILVLVSAALGVATASGAQGQDADDMAGLFDLSLEDLMEVRVVTGTSRLPDESGPPSSPVSVITAEDIRASGLTTIPEILRFACGVDVLQIERRRFAVGVHGLHETFSDRTTLLIDGRLADNPVYGGPDFQGLPLLIDDIERIEVVRSPGSASWGANALTGVINIVTKKPADIPGGMAKTTVTEFGDSYTQLRWAQVNANSSWRLSAGYEDVKSSEDALDGGAAYESGMPALNPLMGFDTFVASDFTRNLRLDSEAFFDLSDATKLAVGLGYTHIDAGDYELGGFFPREDDREDHVRSYVRLNRDLENHRSVSVQWAGKYWDASWPMATPLTTQQHEFETQYNFRHHADHHSSVGVSFRWDHIDSSPTDPQQARLAELPLDEYNTGLFAIDRWTVSDRWTLEAQLRGDWYSGTGGDWSGRLTALAGLDPEKKRVLRFSAAKAFRAPLAQLREASSTRVPLGGGFYVANLVAPEDLDNEQIYCLETGYTARLSQAFSLQVDTFYQRFEDMIGYRQSVSPLNPNIMLVTPDNIDGAEAWGSDVELSYDASWGKLVGWYSYNQFDLDQVGQNILAFLPPRHKVGVRFRREILSDCTLNINYAYADTTVGTPVVGVSTEGAYHRLDLTLSKSFNEDRGEFQIGVSDVFNQTLDPVRESITYTGHELPGRTFFASLRLNF